MIDGGDQHQSHWQKQIIIWFLKSILKRLGFDQTVIFEPKFEKTMSGSRLIHLQRLLVRLKYLEFFVANWYWKNLTLNLFILYGICCCYCLPELSCAIFFFTSHNFALKNCLIVPGNDCNRVYAMMIFLLYNFCVRQNI